MAHSEEHLSRVRRICAGLPAKPDKFFRPPYVGLRGWVGIELGSVDDEELASHLRGAWSLVAPKKLRSPVHKGGAK